MTPATELERDDPDDLPDHVLDRVVRLLLDAEREPVGEQEPTS